MTHETNTRKKYSQLMDFLLSEIPGVENTIPELVEAHNFAIKLRGSTLEYYYD